MKDNERKTSNLIKGHHMVVLGRIGLDIYAEPVGASLEEAEFYRPVLGGSAGNIAAGLARLGQDVWMLSKLSDDAIGRRARREMRDYGIHQEYTSSMMGDARTSIHFAENRMEDIQVVLYRNGAADFELSPADVAQVDFAKMNALVVTGTALAKAPSRDAVFAALQAAGDAGCARVIDLDYRAPTWASEEEAAKYYKEASALCDIVIGNDEEFGVMAGGVDAGRELAQTMGQDRLVIYKMGAEGAIAIDHGAMSQHGIFPTEAIKPIGAGDSFMAAFLTKLADGADLNAAIEFGAAHAAMVVASPACAPAMRRREEIENFIAQAMGKEGV